MIEDESPSCRFSYAVCSNTGTVRSYTEAGGSYYEAVHSYDKKINSFTGIKRKIKRQH